MNYSFVRGTLAYFALYCIILLPFPFSILGLQQRVIDAIFWLPVHSDSKGMYLLVLYIFIAAVITSIIFKAKDKLLDFIYSLSSYYLSLMLFKYGIDKIFLHQFYIPEPNTLFTPLGQMEKGLLYWSTMGTSSFYSIFMGSIEIIAAMLLLFRKTRVFALILSLGIIINIVTVNLGFDISVKLYSLFLLFLCIYLLIPFIPAFYSFFFKAEPVSERPSPGLKRNNFIGMFCKWLAVGIILLEGLYPYIQSRNLNDSLAQRPFLHGAYNVIDRSSPVKRFFIHRKGYIIFQDRNDVMKDYKLTVRDSNFLLTDYHTRTTVVPFQYQKEDSVLTLYYPIDTLTFKISGKAIDWRKLPAMRKGFHWISE